jgi:hypothetical protein
MSERSELVAPCGLDCGVCELYLSRNNEQLVEFLVSKGIPKELLPCNGCREIEGECPVVSGICATYVCANEKAVAFCSECSDFPCSKLAPAADRAETLPHNIKLYNLCIIDRHGVEELVKRSSDVKKAYFGGKMRIGEGPRLESAE